MEPSRRRRPVVPQIFIGNLLYICYYAFVSQAYLRRSLFSQVFFLSPRLGGQDSRVIIYFLH